MATTICDICTGVVAEDDLRGELKVGTASMMSEGRKFDVCIECVHGLYQVLPEKGGFALPDLRGRGGPNPGHEGVMVFKPVCCVCGQEIRPWHLFYRPAPGEHICIPCSEKEAHEEEKKSAEDDG